MMELEHDGKRQKVIARDIQFHPVSDAPMHVDLFRVNEKTRIDVEVTVNFINEEASPGLKRGGVLNVVRHAVEVNVPAGSIPDQIDVDLSGYDIGDSIHISAVTLPEGVTPAITDRDFTIATIQNSRAARATEDEEGAEGEETEAEGDEE